MVERINSSAVEEGGSEKRNGFDSLAQQSEGFDAEKARTLIESEKSHRTEPSMTGMESPESSRIKAQIEKHLSQKTQPEGTETNQNAKDNQNENEQPQVERDFISRKYASNERYYIDEVKKLLTPENISDFERRQIITRPSTFRKIVRIVADTLGIKNTNSGVRRADEAIPAAIAEFRAEELKNSEKKRTESLAEDMASAREGLENRRKIGFEKQRIQENVEKDLNKRILNIDQLEELSLIESSGVEKDSVPFEGSEIPLYTLKGLPTSILATTIDYKLGSGENALGSGMAKKVLEDPSLWLKPRHVVEEEDEGDEYGEEGTKAAGNTICAWYANLERNLDGIIPGSLIYGLGPVDGDSIVQISIGDGDTSNTMGKTETKLSESDLNILDKIEGPGSNGYSEITLRRYNEEGAPKRPQFIVVFDGEISDFSLRHAKFYDIPIVNIERSSYWEKAQEMSNQIIDSISEDDSYGELIRKIQNLQSIELNKRSGGYREIVSIGRDMDAYPILKSSNLNPTTYSEKLANLSSMEFMKRLKFIGTTLREVTEEIERATRNGVSASIVPPQFSSFDVKLYDYRHKKEVDVRGDSDYWSNETRNHIRIDFKLKESIKEIRTIVYDADDSVDETLADDVPYRSLEHLVEKYISAVRKNDKITRR